MISWEAYMHASGLGPIMWEGLWEEVREGDGGAESHGACTYIAGEAQVY